MLPGLGAAFGEVCRDYLNGRCGSNDCKLNHPLHNQLMASLSAGSTMGAPGQMPMGPSAAAAELSGLWFPPLLIQQKQLMIRRSDCSRSTEPPPLRVLERYFSFIFRNSPILSLVFAYVYISWFQIPTKSSYIISLKTLRIFVFGIFMSV